MKAKLFDKQSSGFDRVEIEIKEGALHIKTAEHVSTYLLSEITFSSRLGNMPRSIYLGDGKVCECEDNDFIDKALKEFKIDGGSGFIHHLESNSIYILPALFITISVIFLFLKFVVPYSAEKIASSIPQNIASQVGQGSLEALDKIILKPTKLSKEKQEELRSDFKKMTQSLQDLPPLALHFRFSEEIGPNAFALPDGSIIITDQLVLLSKNNNELLSIFAHEIGHIKNRHAIRMVLQNSAVLVIIATLTGDATTASSVLSALPTMLIESSFSRELENEADAYALFVMKKNNISLHHFADIMTRLSDGYEESKTQEYFSSHPITSSRISKFKD